MCLGKIFTINHLENKHLVNYIWICFLVGLFSTQNLIDNEKDEVLNLLTENS